jgi:uncharacterized membrane protein YbhN (UPF0104 family)
MPIRINNLPRLPAGAAVGSFSRRKFFMLHYESMTFQAGNPGIPAPPAAPSPQPGGKRRLATALQLLLGLGLLAWLLSRLEPGSVTAVLLSLRAWPAVILLLLVTLDRVLMAFKWNLLLRALGICARFLEVVRIYYVGSFYGLVLPTGLGGDAIRFVGITRLTGNRAGVLASLVMEKALGMLGAALFAIFALWVLVTQLRIDLFGIPYFLAAALAAVVVLLPLSLSEGFARRLHALMAHLHIPLAGKVSALHESYLQYNHHRGTLAAFVGLTVVEQLVPVVHNMALAWTMGLPVKGWVFVGLIPVILLLTRLPISVDAIGISEGLYAFLFHQCGYSYSEGLLLAVGGRLSVYLSLLPALFFSSAREVQTPRAP